MKELLKLLEEGKFIQTEHTIIFPSGKKLWTANGFWFLGFYPDCGASFSFLEKIKLSKAIKLGSIKQAVQTTTNQSCPECTPIPLNVCPECSNDGGFCNFCGNKPITISNITTNVQTVVGDSGVANDCTSKPPENVTFTDPYKRMVNQMKDNAELVNYPPKIYDPYEAIGSNLRVHHPVQPKTQVEKWLQERLENVIAIKDCGCDIENCPKQGTDNCNERRKKNNWIEEQIAKDHEEKGRFIGRTPTGTFADDKMIVCNEEENPYSVLFEVPVRVSLLDKIKKLLCYIF